MRVCVVAELYPRAHDPVLGIWAHRQVVAARDAGADVRVVVLHRPIPPHDTPKRERRRQLGTLLRQPRHATLDGLAVDYVRFVAPPQARSYGAWGAWAAPPLALHLRALRRRWAFDLIHAHTTAVVLANSRGIERSATRLGARSTCVVRLGTDIPRRCNDGDGASATTIGTLPFRNSGLCRISSSSSPTASASALSRSIAGRKPGRLLDISYGVLCAPPTSGSTSLGAAMCL